MPPLVIASGNPDKLEEFRRLLSGCGWRLLAPSEANLALDVAETGRSYSENARLKARAYRDAAAMAALADDSGLEVDALGGEPGPLHHERGWDGADQADRIRLLLRALEGVPLERRTARFRAVLCVALPDGRELETEGTCEGLIALAPTGAGGFGYDPVFLLPSLGKTMAQLSMAEKNRVSHRAAAAAALRPLLRQLAVEEM